MFARLLYGLSNRRSSVNIFFEDLLTVPKQRISIYSKIREMLVAFNPINADIEDHKTFHIVFILAEIGADEDDEIQESQLQDSFIHPEIKYLIKLDTHTKPYTSNLVSSDTSSNSSIVAVILSSV